jgi:periplasmic protein CpxP/Spy
MKKLFLMLSAMFALVATTFAQTAQAADPVEQKQKGKDKMHTRHQHKDAQGAMKSLGLNEEQKTKMKTVHGSYQGKFKAIKTDQTLSKEQKMAQMKELKAAQDAETKGILTPDQYTKLGEMKKNRMAQAKEHRGKGGKRGFKKEGEPAPQKN